MALAFGALIKLGFEIWFQKGCGLDRCFPNVLWIGAKFPRWKSGSILPYFCGGNLATLRLRCVIAHKTLFSPSFRRENTTTRMPHRSHRNDCAHNIAWICTYNNCLGHIPTLQGQEHSWLERVAHVATRVHHTKCTITHIQAYIGIYTS